MIRLVELSPAAGDALVKQLELEPNVEYHRSGTRFTFPRGDFPHAMHSLSRNLGSVLARYGNSHLIEDKYV